MKANELMIGDYLMHNGLPYRVIQVDGIVRDGWMIENGEEDCGELIPLTPEILEKNGFEKVQIHGEKQDDIFQCFDGEIIIEVGTYDPNFITIRYRYETPDGIKSGELSSIVKVDGGKFYHNELQHALRLCGIEKEIIL